MAASYLFIITLLSIPIKLAFGNVTLSSTISCSNDKDPVWLSPSGEFAFGYVAPAWFKNVPVTAKVDVYSFGVMLLEIICCRRSMLMDQSGEEEKAVLTDWAYDCYMEGRIDALVEDDREAMADMGRLQKWVTIAMWCIQEYPDIRRTTKMVMQMLDGFVHVPTPPSPFSLI